MASQFLFTAICVSFHHYKELIMTALKLFITSIVSNCLSKLHDICLLEQGTTFFFSLFFQGLHTGQSSHWLISNLNNAIHNLHRRKIPPNPFCMSLFWERAAVFLDCLQPDVSLSTRGAGGGAGRRVKRVKSSPCFSKGLSLLSLETRLNPQQYYHFQLCTLTSHLSAFLQPFALVRLATA